MKPPGPSGIQAIVSSYCRPYGCVSVLVQTTLERQHEGALDEESSCQGSRSVTKKPGLSVQVILIIRMSYCFKKLGICEFTNCVFCVHSMLSTVLKEPQLG